MKAPGDLMCRFMDVRNFVTLKVATLEHEIFGAMLMDQAGRYIAHEDLFRGTTLHSAVYPREIIKFALKHNASKILFYHNHPGGTLQPSPMDVTMTKQLSELLHIVDVEVVDHIIAAGGRTFSFKQGGLLK